MNKPPKGQLFFLAIMTVFMMIHLGNIVRMLQLPNELADQISLSPVFEVGVSIFWLIITCSVLISLLRNRISAVNRAIWVSFGFIVYSIIRLMIFARADYDHQRVIFLVVVTLATLLLFSFAYGLIRHARKLGNT